MTSVSYINPNLPHIIPVLKSNPLNPNNSNEPNLIESPPTKSRKKVCTRACDGCHKGKTKCEKIGESCTNCIKKSFKCTYLIPQKKRGPKSKHSIPTSIKIPSTTCKSNPSPVSSSPSSEMPISVPPSCYSSRIPSPLPSPVSTLPSYIRDFFTYLGPTFPSLSLNYVMSRLEQPMTPSFSLLISAISFSTPVWIHPTNYCHQACRNLSNVIDLMLTVVPNPNDYDYTMANCIITYIHQFCVSTHANQPSHVAWTTTPTFSRNIQRT